MSRFPNKPIFQAKLVGGKFIMGNVRATRPFQNQTRNVVINNRITTAQNVVAGSVTVVDKPKKKGWTSTNSTGKCDEQKVNNG